MGAVSPPGGDFSDPVTSATLAIVQVGEGLTSCMKGFVGSLPFVGGSMVGRVVGMVAVSRFEGEAPGSDFSDPITSATLAIVQVGGGGVGFAGWGVWRSRGSGGGTGMVGGM